MIRRYQSSHLSYSLFLLLFFCCSLSFSQSIRYLEGHSEPIYSVDYSQDGNFLVTGSFDSTVRVWDRESQKTIRTIDGLKGLILSVKTSPDSRTLAIGGTGNVVEMYELPSKDPIHSIPSLPDELTCITTSVDGKWFAMGAKNGNVSVWDVENQKIKADCKSRFCTIAL